MAETVRLATGADMRLTGAGALAVVCVDGRRRAEAPGTWSAPPERLVSHLAPFFPGLAFPDVRHRVKSRLRLDLPLPGILGVPPRPSLRAVARARAHGIEAAHALIPGAVHGLAVRTPWGGLLPHPRAERGASLAAAELARFARGSAG